MSSLNIVLLVFSLLLIIGLCLPSTNRTELFDNPLKSTEESVEGGASELYNWGYKEIDGKKKKKKVHKPDNDYVDDYDETPAKCVKEDDKCDKSKICRRCDITQNRDIDKYVLKSSVPPCPDMSKYIEKRNLPPYPEMSNYILKSKVPSCPNLDDYILKSKIPPCAPCRECPSCEDCPPVPDMDNYVKKDKLDKICRNRGGNGDPIDNGGSWLPNFSWPSWLTLPGATIDDESQPTDNPILPQSGSDAAGSSGSSSGATDTSSGDSTGLGDTSGAFNSIVDGESAEVQEGFGNNRVGTNKIAFGKMAGSGCGGVCCGNYGEFGV